MPSEVTGGYSTVAHPAQLAERPEASWPSPTRRHSHRRVRRVADDKLTRRTVVRRGLRIGVGGVTIGALGGTGALSGCGRDEAPPSATQQEVVPGLWVNRRAAWGDDLPPTGPIGPDTMRFLLVHHAQSSNSDRDPRSTIRGIYAFHTGPAKRWPDVCYHYFIGRDGSIWEGRAGSLDGGVEASATGGNQGWALLVCLLGDYRRVSPSAAAQDSLVKVLAWNARRYGIDPTATVTYRSRGSNRFPAGTIVTTPAISAHRDTSYTECPGDVGYQLMGEWRARVAAVPPPVFPKTGPYSPAERLGAVDSEFG